MTQMASQSADSDSLYDVGDSAGRSGNDHFRKLRTMRSLVNAYCVTHDAKFDFMEEIKDRLRIARLRMGVSSPTEAARKFGWTVSTYLGYENGDRQPGKAMAERMASAYRVSLDWLLTGRGSPTGEYGSIVTIVGRIGAGAQIDVGVEQVQEGGEQIETVIPLPAGAIGFEVVGDSMWPRYDQGDVIVCEAKGIPVDDLPEGEEAAVRTSEGLRYLKRVYRGQPKGFHNLISHNAAPINGAQIDWAADVVAIIRANKWRRITNAERRRLAKRAVSSR